MKFVDIKFLLSVHKLSQLPPATLPEIAFAGRSNVGKSSLINTLVGRKGLVKVSGRPGKTQGLNFFQLAEERISWICLVMVLPKYHVVCRIIGNHLSVSIWNHELHSAVWWSLWISGMVRKYRTVS